MASDGEDEILQSQDRAITCFHGRPLSMFDLRHSCGGNALPFAPHAAAAAAARRPRGTQPFPTLTPTGMVLVSKTHTPFPKYILVHAPFHYGKPQLAPLCLLLNWCLQIHACSRWGGVSVWAHKLLMEQARMFLPTSLIKSQTAPVAGMVTCALFLFSLFLAALPFSKGAPNAFQELKTNIEFRECYAAPHRRHLPPT